MSKNKNKQNKQLQKQQQTTRQLIGIEGINEYSLQTSFGDLAFFSVKPTNISVLSDENLSSKINSLATVLKSITEIEIFCINSRENFDGNKNYLKERLHIEENPAVRELLQKEADFLDHIQAQTAATREFLMIARLRGVKEKEVFPYLSRIEKVLKEQGFTAEQLGYEEIKLLLGVFFEQNVTSEKLEDTDGERWILPAVNEIEAQNKSIKSMKTSSAPSVKNFIDMIAPSIIKFYTDYYICGNTYRCVWALREYPTSTSEQALLRYLGEKENVSLRIYTRQVNAAEERKIIANAASKNRLARSRTNDLQQTVAAESNLLDVTTLVANMHRNREPLMHTAVYIELSANNIDDLRLLQTEVQTELVRAKLNVDRLLLRQQQGFMCVMPSGRNVFREQFERVLPASSVANLYPFSFSGKTDEQGFYIGRDKFGSNIIADFNKRADDKTNANVLILGNSGQGKSYLLKLILTNLRMSGKHILCLDPEQEYVDLTNELGGCYIDLMSGEHIINVLEPKAWEETEQRSPLFSSYAAEAEETVPKAFLQSTKLSQHISFLRDFFRTYKDFSEREIDTIELMLIKLYDKFGITDRTDFSKLKPTDYPVLSDLYELMEHEHKNYDEKEKNLYTAKVLQDVCLGLHSICTGAESRFFNGYTNIESDEMVSFGVKGLLQASKNIRNALLFNVLSYMSDRLLSAGNSIASVDEFYLFLTNLTAVEYIRNFMKRVRKKESAVILASQNIEDFLTENVRELTKPLFAIPTHQFLFNAGTVDSKFYIDALQLEPSEFNLIRYPQRGVCLYKCGNERFNLMVKAPEYKARLFGKAGGR